MNDINNQLICSVVQGNILEIQALSDQGADANTRGVMIQHLVLCFSHEV
jgi:hypothetical protein